MAAQLRACPQYRFCRENYDFTDGVHLPSFSSCLKAFLFATNVGKPQQQPFDFSGKWLSNSPPRHYFAICVQNKMPPVAAATREQYMHNILLCYQLFFLHHRTMQCGLRNYFNIWYNSLNSFGKTRLKILSSVWPRVIFFAIRDDFLETIFLETILPETILL